MMERMEKRPLEAEMSVDELNSEIARLSKELIGLEGQLGRVSSETGGNSLDDQAIEETLVDQEEGQRIAQIGSIRQRINELEAAKARLSKKA